MAVEIKGWFAIIYIAVNLIWASWWCYKNFDMLDRTSDFILTTMKKKAYYKGKVIEEKKRVKKK